MNSIILSKTYTQPPFCEKEILRYAGCRTADDEVLMLMQACLKEVQGKLTYKVCYREFPITVDSDICDFEVFRFASKNLAVNLHNCKKVILFAATVGVEIDRLIARYGRISPAKALMFQAIGAERIEALCDAFCGELSVETGMGLRPRFSPGYGDLPLAAQKDIFAVLDCDKRIGLSLNDSLLMSPSKSVTAFVGLYNEPDNSASGSHANSNRKQIINKCSACNKKDCAFRGAL